MSGLANMIDTGGQIARGASLGLNLRQMDFQQAAELRAEEQRQAQLAVQNRLANRHLNLSQDEFDLRKQEVDSKNQGQAALGNMAGRLLPGLIQQQQHDPAQEVHPDGAEGGFGGAVDQDPAEQGGTPAGPQMRPFTPNPIWHPPMLDTSEGQAVDRPMGTFAGKGGAAAKSGLDLSGLDLSHAPEHVTGQIVQSAIAESMRQQRQDRLRKGVQDDMARYVGKFRNMPSSSALGKFARDPTDETNWDAAANELGPRMRDAFLETVYASKMSQYADMEKVVGDMTNRVLGQQHGQVTPWQQHQLDQQAATPEAIARVRQLHPETFDTDEKAAAYINERAAGRANELPAPGTGERQMNPEHDPEYLRLRGEAADAEHEWKNVTSALSGATKYGDPDPKTDPDGAANVKLLRQNAKEAKQSLDDARKAQFDHLKSISGKGSKSKAASTATPGRMPRPQTAGWDANDQAALDQQTARGAPAPAAMPELSNPYGTAQNAGPGAQSSGKPYQIGGQTFTLSDDQAATLKAEGKKRGIKPSDPKAAELVKQLFSSSGG